MNDAHRPRDTGPIDLKGLQPLNVPVGVHLAIPKRQRTGLAPVPRCCADGALTIAYHYAGTDLAGWYFGATSARFKFCPYCGAAL